MKTPVIAILVMVPVLAVAAAWWASSGTVDESLRAELDTLRQRVADLERQDEARVTAQRAAERHVAQLEERVVEAELREAHARATRGGGNGAGGGHGDGRQAARPLADEAPAAPAVAGPGTPAEAAAASAKSAIQGLDLTSKTLTARMDGLKTRLATMQLRQLPEDERWERAVTDVGLNDNQVAVLRRAFGERDVAYADATVREKSQDDDGSWVVETRIDAQALADADRQYEASTTGVMTIEQGKAWTTGGFAGAFGTPRPANVTQRYPPKR